MPANTAPIFGAVPAIGTASLTTTSVVTGSVGIGTIGTNMFLTFVAGANGSFVQKVRFMSVARTAAITGIATVLRVYFSSKASGATTAADTFLLGEMSVPAISSANATNASNFYDYPLNFALPPNQTLLVSQHTAQTTDQNWVSVVIGSNY